MTDTPDTITREEADARVTAALREAADAIKVPRYCDEKDLPKVRALHEARKAILALIPNAGGALDRAVAEAVQAEREACAMVAFDLLCDAGEPGTAAIVGDAIRARTEGKEAPRLDAITCSAFDDRWSAEKTFGSFPRHGARTEGEG